MTDIRYMTDGSGLLDVDELGIMREIEAMSIEDIEKELRAEGVDLERFERELREKIAAKRKEISKMTFKEAVDDFGKKEETEDLPRMITGDQGEAAGPQERNPSLQAADEIRNALEANGDALEAAIGRGEETAMREAMFEILLHVKDAPLTAESAREILERHGLEGLMVLVSDDEPEIQEETAAIDNLFDDLIDQDVLSRELST